MASAIVTVVSVDGDSAFVETSGAAGCSSCAGVGGCGTRKLLAIFGNKSVALRVDNRFDAEVGDRVEIGIEHATILKLSALSYLMPLVGLTGGGAVGAVAGLGDVASFAFALIGLAAAFGYSRYLYSTARWEREIAPICLRRIASGDEHFVDITAIR